ncbi:MAG: hypothetical protein IJC45_01720 [Clostridia bacterium]|nr:hypothetical protein [Clostridia bacterium]
MENNNRFEYAYNASQQEEIRRIREKYLPPAEKNTQDKLEQLRRLDGSVDKKSTVVALVIGILSTLILGIGMCCCLVWEQTLFAAGIVIGLIGIAGIAAAYPLYIHVTKKERERIAPEIMELTDSLLDH